MQSYTRLIDVVCIQIVQPASLPPNICGPLLNRRVKDFPELHTHSAIPVTTRTKSFTSSLHTWTWCVPRVNVEITECCVTHHHNRTAFGTRGLPPTWVQGSTITHLLGVYCARGTMNLHYWTLKRFVYIDRVKKCLSATQPRWCAHDVLPLSPSIKDHSFIQPIQPSNQPLGLSADFIHSQKFLILNWYLN